MSPEGCCRLLEFQICWKLIPRTWYGNSERSTWRVASVAVVTEKETWTVVVKMISLSVCVYDVNICLPITKFDFIVVFCCCILRVPRPASFFCGFLTNSLGLTLKLNGGFITVIFLRLDRASATACTFFFCICPIFPYLSLVRPGLPKSPYRNLWGLLDWDLYFSDAFFKFSDTHVNQPTVSKHWRYYKCIDWKESYVAV